MGLRSKKAAKKREIAAYPCGHVTVKTWDRAPMLLCVQCHQNDGFFAILLSQCLALVALMAILHLQCQQENSETQLAL